jgi:ectoine hydroxylase-related dioxygenase (phytanoyl-CoA dioxygenase family)
VKTSNATASWSCPVPWRRHRCVASWAPSTASGRRKRARRGRCTASPSPGWNVYVYHCHLDVHPPEQRGQPAWRWHQDGGRQNVELDSPRPRLSVKVAYFLTDVSTAEHGALRVVPGSHRRDSLPRDREPMDAVPVLVPAGSAVIFDRRLWHARGDNLSDRTRKALFYGYTHRWIRPRDELRLDPDRLARLTPLRRQLLGCAEDTSDYWFPEEAALRSRIPL